MLQIAPHDAADAEVLRFSGHAGQDAADAADDHVDLHAGAGGLHELFDDVHIGNGVDLDADAALLPLGDLRVHVLQHGTFQGAGRHQQMAVGPLQVADGHVFEKFRRVGADALVCRQQGQIGILLRRFLVVVAGAHLGDVSHFAVLPAGDQADLGMDFVFFKAVEDGAACVLQPLGPVDVVLFVEAGPQLDEHGHVLAVLRRGAEIVHQLCLAGQAVYGDLDGDHRRVLRRLLDQLQEGGHAFKGIGQQPVPALDLLDDAFAGMEIAGQAGGEGGVEQGTPLSFGQLVR